MTIQYWLLNSEQWKKNEIICKTSNNKHWTIPIYLWIQTLFFLSFSLSLYFRSFLFLYSKKLWWPFHKHILFFISEDKFMEVFNCCNMGIVICVTKPYNYVYKNCFIVQKTLLSSTTVYKLSLEKLIILLLLH